jgi:RecG-like helicase
MLVSVDLPLNRKQRLVVERVLSGALAWKNHAYDASKREQMLHYVGGEGGVGKSQVIKAIVAGMDFIHRKDEVIFMAPTGAAADNISRNTYHTCLGISLAKIQKPTVKSHIRKL